MGNIKYNLTYVTEDINACKWDNDGYLVETMEFSRIA